MDGKKTEDGRGTVAERQNAHPPQLKHPRALDIVGNYGFLEIFSTTTTTTDDSLRSGDELVSTNWPRVGNGNSDESRRGKRGEGRGRVE